MKPVTKKKIGWGFVATGRIATEFAECLKLLDDDCYIAAVGSRTLESAKRFTDMYGGKPYGSYEEMMQDPDVDVVYIATPHMVHEENVKMAAEYGKHILCEKPFAVNRPQAQRMFDAADEAGVFIMEGLWSRFFPAWEYARKVLESGELGKLISIDAATCWGAPRGPEGFPPDDRRIDPNLAGGALLDAGIYSLAAMSRVRGKFDMPTELFSMMSFDPTGVDGDDDMMMKFEDGMVAHLCSSLHRRDMECKIICEKGLISIPVNRNPDKIMIQERAEFPRLPKDLEKKAEEQPKKTGMRDYYASMNLLPISQRRMGGRDILTMEFPYRKSGFQFEAEVVQKCYREGLKTCPDVTPEETLMLVSIADEVRRRANYFFPFEK